MIGVTIMHTYLNITQDDLVANTVVAINEAINVINLDLFAASGILSRESNDLIFSYDDGSRVSLENFFLVHHRANTPDFNIEGNEISGADFFAALDATEIMPAMGGPQNVALGGGVSIYEIALQLVDGIGSLGELEAAKDTRFDGAFQTKFTGVTTNSTDAVAANERVHGSEGDDVLHVSFVKGGEIYGYGGDDNIRVEGNVGAYIDGGAGKDVIAGGAGNDVIVYDTNDDFNDVSGGLGLDILLVKNGDSIVSAEILAKQGFEAIITGIDSNISAEFINQYGINVGDNKIVLNGDDHGTWGHGSGADMFVYIGNDGTKFELSAVEIEVELV